MTTVDSTSDERTVNNVMRHQYRVLTDAEKQQMQAIKDKGLELHDLIESIGQSRELSVAKTKTEEAVMWAVKHLTAGRRGSSACPLRVASGRWCSPTQEPLAAGAAAA